MLNSRAAATGRDLPGVSGAVVAAGVFADAWCARTGQGASVVRALRMYRLGELVRPSAVSGASVLAVAPDDVELVADWLVDSHREAQPDEPAEQWHSLAQRRIAAGEIHLWHDSGAPVAVAAVSSAAAGVARVGPVYSSESAPSWIRCCHHRRSDR